MGNQNRQSMVGFPLLGRITWGTNMPFEDSESTFGANPSIVNLFGELRKLSNSKLRRKRRKGLCYWRDEKWVPRHSYEKKELSVLIQDADEGDWGKAEDLEEAKPKSEAT